ncbi:MAG TPA: MDR family MFS transporter [Acidimicrobiales bacterium]|nr:MDR family MFS transporter [Acidimicrobiales bacterium]
MTPKGAGVQLEDREIWRIVAGLMFGGFLSVLDVLIVITALPTIVGDLGERADISWIVTAYLLTSTAAAPIFGKLSDLYGRMRLYQLAILIFIAGSAVSALSQTMGMLIIGRAVQGVGCAGLMTLPSAMVADVAVPRQRARFQSVTILNFTLASALGPLVGGIFVDDISWRWIFWINLPLGALALIATTRLHVPTRRAATVVIDYAGSALVVALASCLLLAVTDAENGGGFGSPRVLILLAAGAMLTGLLVIVERRAAEPIMPPRFFHHRRFNLVSVTTVLYNAAIQAAWTLMPIFFQVVKGASATVSGLLVLPFVIGTTISSIATGRLISRTGRYKWAALTGQVLTAAAFVLYASMTTGTSRFQATVYMAVAGLGIGCVLNPLVVIVQNTVATEDLGAATAATGLFRQLGSAFGAAVGLGIYSGHLAGNIRRSHLTGLPKAALQGAPAQIRTLPAAAHQALIGAFEHALRSAFAWTAPTVIVSIVLTLVMRDLHHDHPAVAEPAPAA